MHTLKFVSILPDDLTRPEELKDWNLSHRMSQLQRNDDPTQVYDVIEVFGSENDLTRFLVDTDNLGFYGMMADFDPMMGPEVPGVVVA